MKNLKRVFSMALAMIMLLGMMILPGAAADFADEDKIVNKEAVAITAGMGLFAGAEGKFMPEGTVTRAQMATIIVKMLNGSDVNADSFKGSGKFSDTADFEGGWAEGYINWCATLGVVAGYGDGTFKPGREVTAAEAVTMILNALKVDAGEGTWPMTVMAKAEEIKLFEDLATKPGSDAVLNRDQLAVVVLNGLNYSPKGTNAYAVGDKKFDSAMDAHLYAQSVGGTVETAFGVDSLAGSVYELKAASGTVMGNQDTGLEYTQLSDGKRFDIETTRADIGHYVTVYYKETYENDEKPGVTYAVVDETKYNTENNRELDMKVLFIGNSAVYYTDLPSDLTRLAGNNGIKLQCDSVTKGAATLDMFAGSDATLNQNALSAIAQGYDVVFIQDNGGCIKSEDAKLTSVEAGQTLAEAIRASGADVGIYIRPPYYKDLNGFTSLQQCEEFDKHFLTMADTVDADMIAYVNRAFAIAIEEIDYFLWVSTTNDHMNDLGGYLAVCVFYATLTNDSATSLGTDGLPEADARILQQIADRVVLNGENPFN